MSLSSSNSSNTVKIIYYDGIAIPYIIRFWIFLVSNILSLICCLFVIFHYLFDPTLRRGLHNHVMIVTLFACLIWEVTIVPWTMYVFLFEVVWIQTPTFCIIWKSIDATLYSVIAQLVAWASVERHILIFHDRWMSTKRKRYLVHYAPLGFIVIFSIMYYGITTPMNYCNQTFFYFVVTCGYFSCLYNNAAFALYDFFGGGLLYSVLIGFGSIFLILRVVFRKRHVQRQGQWRKHRKMTVQLLSITSLFFILYLPPIILGTAYKLGLPSYVGIEYSTYAPLFAYYIVFLFPFACINTLPKLGNRIKNTLRCFKPGHANAVAP